MSLRPFLWPAGRLAASALVAVVLAGCGGAASGRSDEGPAGYLSGEGPGWYDGVRYLSLTESDGRLTGFLSAVVPDSAEGAVQVQYALDGYADGDTLSFTATADPDNADTYLGGSGTWLGRQEGETLVLTIPSVGTEDEFRPATEQEFNGAAAQAITVAMQQHEVWAANDAAGRALDDVDAAGRGLSSVADFTDLLAEYDTNLADLREAVASLSATGDCYYYDLGVEYELDAIADLDSRLLAPDAAEVASDAAALDSAQARSRAAHEALDEAVAILPDGVDTSPRATVTADQLQAVFDTADRQRDRAQSAVAAAQEHAAEVRAEAQALAAGADTAGC